MLVYLVKNFKGSSMMQTSRRIVYDADKPEVSVPGAGAVRDEMADEDPSPVFWESHVYNKSDIKKLKDNGFSYYDDATIFRYLFYSWFNKWALALSRKYMEPYKMADEDPSPVFWESHVYNKSDIKKLKDNGFSYYDDATIFRYLFYSWFNKWALALSRKYLEPYKLHPLQVSDQILKWEPIFSKHVSDGLVRLDLYEATKSCKNPVKPSNILLRAILLTTWKRSFALFLALVIGNILSMSISILVEKLITIVSNPEIHVAKTVLLLFAVVCFQIMDGLLLENIYFYLNRMIYTLHYLYGIVPFRHGMSNRRLYYNNINGSNLLNTCNQVLHSFSPDSPCSKNPLFCPSLRYHNKEMSPKVFTYVFYDSFYIALAFDSTRFIVEFLTNFIYGVFLMSRHVKANLWVLYVTGALFLIFMVTIEIFNALIYKYILYMRDYKVTKYNNILGRLSNIKKMFCDDIGFNIITQTRNDELSLVFIKIFITFLNMCAFSTSINVSFYLIKSYFVKTVNDANVITDINTAAFMTTFYIYMRIVTSMFKIPRAINVAGMAYASYKRLNKYLSGCSPNFYVADNKFTGSANVSSIIADTTDQLPNDTVVYYKNASFTWVYTRNDLLNKNYDTHLKNLNFLLKRSEIAIVTGSKGSGKSNFVKSVLGEMTLVGGSMAVVPLHTSMPIFYASQDIWLKHGSIRSIITFGYKFDEHLYKTVLKAVELEFDISTWEKGDLRVVSDNAPSLSGGQRVRMELARAVYAYLIFHQVNKEYNNSKCSFLMCLDASFHGLDPYVSKTIFNNLFNVKSGLLVKNDLSVVLTSSKQILDTCTKSCDPAQFPKVPIFNVKNKELAFLSYLGNFIRNKRHEGDFNYSTYSKAGYYTLNRLNNDMLGFCFSDNSRSSRAQLIKQLYGDSFVKYNKNLFGKVWFKPYFMFMKPAAVSFALYIILTVALNAMDYVKLVLSTNLSDYITKNINDHNKGTIVDLAVIKSRFLEAVSQMNSVIDRSITGGSVYRSFNRNSDLLRDFLEHRDYKARTKFLFVAVVSWSTILFTWIFSLTTFIILVIPIILDKYTNYKMTVGYFGLALSLCTNVIKSFSNFSFMYACNQMNISSIDRFQYFIPPGQKLKFDKCPNTHEEYVVNPESKHVSDMDKKQLLRRRAIEFKNENKRFYALRRLFYHPKLHILDVNDYLTHDRTGVQLKDVCVYTTPEHTPESMILKHLTVAAIKSEIIGIVGRTGAGKTTLLSVLQNISTNRTGQVLLDGKDLNDIPKIVLRQIIGVLPQLPFVFKGWTVRRFLDPRKLFTDDEINQALSKCGLLNFVNELSGGRKLNSILVPEDPLLYHQKSKEAQPSSFKYKSMKLTKDGDESDMLLSYNQLRTLYLARLVLYRHFFRLIVVDEPPEEDTDNADVRKDDLAVPIYDILQKHFSHCTTFVTAHDVNVLKSCTSVWVIHEGCVVKTCKASDVSANESIASIIEENVKSS
nr:ABC transporter [Theileria orientalis]